MATGDADRAVALDEARMMHAIAIGVGCRRGVCAEAIVVLVRETLAGAALPIEGASVFTIDAKVDEPGLAHAARALGAPLVFLSREKLSVIETPTRSAHVLQRFGVGSIAEGAALAGAGVGAVLLVPRVVRNGVTCAVARGSP